MKLQRTCGVIRLIVGTILILPTTLGYAADLTKFLSAPPKYSSHILDHSEWSALLSKYIDEREGLNYFAYGEVSDEDYDRLEVYLDELQDTSVTELTHEQRFAYWINLYNALTVWVILEHYPVDSIRNISFGLFTRGPWKEELVTVQNVELTLDNIEHDILRPFYEDNRIHYAVNCASIGCPNLQSVAFTADNLEHLLEKAAGEYVNHPRGVRVDDGELIVSSIYDWYREDFGDSELALIEHLSNYASDELKSELSQFEEIDDYDYDWALNE